MPTGCTPEADGPTVLVYGHHDVQPVDPVEDWTSPPFEPVIVDGECRARGAIDDKGQSLYQIEAARGLLSLGGGLPVNLKLLIEGEEEVGSPNFEHLLRSESGASGMRRGGGLRHRHDRPGRAVDDRGHERPGRLRRVPANRFDRPAQRHVGRRRTERRSGGGSVWRRPCTTRAAG